MRHISTEETRRAGSPGGRHLRRGVQGRTQLEAIAAVRPIRKALVFDIDAGAAPRSRGEWEPLALEEAGDLIIPLRQGLIREDHIRAEIGEVLPARPADARKTRSPCSNP